METKTKYAPLCLFVNRLEGPKSECVCHTFVNSDSLGLGINDTKFFHLTAESIPMVAMDSRQMWKAANERLRRWASTAPDAEGEANRVDYQIRFINGDVYVGQISLTRRHVEDMDLRQEALKSLHLYAGLARPPAWDEETYRDFLAREPESEAIALQCLATLDFGAQYAPGITDDRMEALFGGNTLPGNQ